MGAAAPPGRGRALLPLGGPSPPLLPGGSDLGRPPVRSRVPPGLPHPRMFAGQLPAGSLGTPPPGSPRHVELVLDPGDCPEKERTPLAPASPTRAPGWRLGGARVLPADPGTPWGAGLGAPPGSGAAAGRRFPCSLRTVSGCVDSSHPRSSVNESLA